MATREIDLNNLNEENIFGFLEIHQQYISSYVGSYHIRKNMLQTIDEIIKFLKIKFQQSRKL